MGTALLAVRVRGLADCCPLSGRCCSLQSCATPGDCANLIAQAENQRHLVIKPTVAISRRNPTLRQPRSARAAGDNQAVHDLICSISSLTFMHHFGCILVAPPRLISVGALNPLQKSLAYIAAAGEGYSSHLS